MAFEGGEPQLLGGDVSYDGSVMRPPGEDVGDYGFLAGLLDETELANAAAAAYRIGVPLHHLLIAQDLITAQDYAAALARLIAATLPPQPTTSTTLIDAASAAPREIAGIAAEAVRRGAAPLIVSRAQLDWAEPERARRGRALEAAHGLRRRRPEMSAATRAPAWQTFCGLVAIGLLIGGIAVAPDITTVALTMLATLPFLFVVGLRVASLALVLRPPLDRRRHERIPDAELPIYTIMAPLYREADVLPDIVEAIAALDYPKAKLDVLLLLESADPETIAAADAMTLPGYVRVLVVPDVAPRTKPKALNYALQHARGDYVVIYDAEDVPDADQLRRAFAMFRAGPPGLACVQACLNIYNSRRNWLTRQFTLEYSALFDAMLPALVRLGIPVPLGGTSNHFPRHVLEDLDGWDAHNVTEDADLGLRIARSGGKVAILTSTTFEEAPPSLPIWFRQRTRWMKGFMQTWSVHMRHPGRLWRELGPRGFLGFQAFLGGIILSTLLYPLSLLLLAYEVVAGELLATPATAFGQTLVLIALFNLLAGHLSGAALAAVAVARRGWLGLVPHVLLLPVYWLLVSAAAYRALWQLVHQPFLWEKTPHAPRSRVVAARSPGRKPERRKRR